jgi:2-iminobutanoate/2-iminopropanoate deaminase
MHSLKSALLTLTVSGALIATPTIYADEAEYMAPPGDNGSAPYSQIVIYDDFVFLSGMLGIVPGTRSLAEGGIGPETRQTMDNIKAALERVGRSTDDVLKCTVFLADIGEWADMNTVYTTYFSNMPARSAVGVSGLALNARVEIECMAAMPESDD